MTTNFILMDEFDNTKLACLDDRIYKRIERAFVAVVGYTITKRLMTKFAEKTLRELSTNSYVDIMSVIDVIN